MNSIISLSDGAGTTITNGQIVTNDLSGNTVTTSSLTTANLNLTGSINIPAVNNITTAYGAVSLKNAGKTYLVGTTYIDGGITASATQTINLGANLPVSTATPTTGTQLITKTYGDTKYPIIDNTLNSLYGGSGAFNNGTSTAQYCIALGTSALAVTTGGFNQAYGTNALLRCTNGAFNMAFGVNSLSNVTSGSSNMAIGTNSLPAGNCSESVGIGQSALQNSTATPGRNTGIGAYVMQNTVGSSLCTSIGYNAGVGGIINGSNNTFIGASTSMTGDYSNSTIIGYSAQGTASNQITLGRASETTRIPGALTVAGSATFSTAPTMSGANITAATIPYASLANDYRIIRSSGTYNFFAGAATVATTLTGDLNTLYGIATGFNLTTGNSNSFYGSSAGWSCTTSSSYNTAIGANAMSGYSSGSSSNNSIVGFSGLSSITTGQSNCGVGYSVLSGLTTGSFNCFLGRFGGSAIVSGNFNCGIGDQVDYNSSYDSSYCSFLGANSYVTASGLSYTTCIGANTACATSNTIQLGSNSETVAFSGSLKSGANTITAAQLGYLAGVSTGIVDTASSQTIGGTKTFSTAPVMSGASITSATIPYASIADNVNLNHRSNAYNFYSGSPSILTTGDTNTFYGYDNVGSYITTGGSNSFFGSSSGRRCALGSSSNTAFGVQAMGYTISSNVNSFNCAIGNLAMGVITTGNRNTVVGYNVAGSISSGSYNSFVGNFAGYNTVAGNYNCGIGDSCFTGNIAYDASYCSFVGASATLSAAGLSYSTVIGAGATSATSSSITLGRTTDTTIIPSASVQYGGSYRPNSVFQTISANTNWNTTPPTYLPQYILFSGISTTTYTLTLPAISSANVFEGMEFQFRRTNTTASATTTSVLQVTASGTDTIYGQGIMTTAASTNVLPSGFYSGRLVCVNKTTTPYNWAYFT